MGSKHVRFQNMVYGPSYKLTTTT